MLTTSAIMRMLDNEMQIRSQEIPGIRQSYNPYTERTVKVASHHCLLNYLDQCLVVVSFYFEWGCYGNEMYLIENGEKRFISCSIES